jgi:hypothetical protein
MAAPKRKKIQINRDRVLIAEYYLQGKTQNQIVEILNNDTTRGYTLTQAIISRDLKAIQSEWLVKSLTDFNQARANELAKIDALEREYWRGWERSRQSKTVSKSKKEESKRKSKQSAELVKEEQVGDPRFLQGIEQCINRRCQLLGLDAPKRLSISPQNIHDKIPWGNLTREQLERLKNGEEPDKVVPGLVINKN